MRFGKASSPDRLEARKESYTPSSVMDSGWGTMEAISVMLFSA